MLVNYGLVSSLKAGVSAAVGAQAFESGDSDPSRIWSQPAVRVGEEHQEWMGRAKHHVHGSRRANERRNRV